jgi:hypothetical protein
MDSVGSGEGGLARPTLKNLASTEANTATVDLEAAWGRRCHSVLDSLHVLRFRILVLFILFTMAFANLIAVWFWWTVRVAHFFAHAMRTVRTLCGVAVVVRTYCCANSQQQGKQHKNGLHLSTLLYDFLREFSFCFPDRDQYTPVVDADYGRKV